MRTTSRRAWARVSPWAALLATALLTGCHGGPVKHDAAREEAEQRWKIARADVKARLAASELEAGRLESAGKALSAARDLDPENVRLRLFDAQVHLNEGRAGEAEALADGLIGEPELAGAAHYLKGVIQQQRGDWPAAAASYATACRLEPQDAGALSAAVSACLQTGEIATATELIDARRDSLNWSGAYHSAAAEVCERRGDWEGATRSWRRVVDLAEDESGLKRLASAAFKAGQWTQALSALRTALTLKPDSASAGELNYRVGLCQQKLGELGAARQSAIAALQADPEHVPSVKLLVELLIEAGSLDDARTLAEQALATYAGGDLDLLQAAAVLAVRLGDHRRAAMLVRQLQATGDPACQALAQQLQVREN